MAQSLPSLAWSSVLGTTGVEISHATSWRVDVKIARIDPAGVDDLHNHRLPRAGARRPREFEALAAIAGFPVSGKAVRQGAADDLRLEVGAAVRASALAGVRCRGAVAEDLVLLVAGFHDASVVILVNNFCVSKTWRIGPYEAPPA